MILQGKNILLRPFEHEDIDRITSLIHRSDLSEFTTPFSIPRNKAWIRDHFIVPTENYANRFKLGIILIASDELCGFVDVFDIDYRHSRAEIGIAIFETRCRQKGYGSEALQIICRWCDGTLNLRRLQAKCFSTNAASLKLFERAGFKCEGILHGYFFVDGHRVDARLFCKLRD
jgi:diamine N-acetyltransferase